MLRHSLMDVANSIQQSVYSPYGAKAPSNEDYGLESLKSHEKEANSATEFETSLIKSIIHDDKAQFNSLSRFLLDSKNFSTMDRIIVSKLLHLCCSFDSVDCATSLVSGELGVVPLVNEVDSDGMSPLHKAAMSHSARCVELLLKKRSRTDLKTRDGRGLLPLELSLSRTRLDVIWSSEDNSVEELVDQLSEKDFTAIKLLSEKTKEIEEVAYASAMEGRVVDIACLLVVAAQKVNESMLELHNADLNSKEKTTIYECVIREALGLGRAESATPPKAAKRNFAPSKSESTGKRKLLLCVIELLQLFGAVAQASCTDKRVTSPLILASLALDEAIIELLMKTNMDINDVDTEGNSALHWCLKASKGSCSQQIKIMWLLLKHGARVNQKNKLGLTAVHIAAANGNSQALKVLLSEDPDSVNSKTETKETPLFFAVKNDCKDCVEILLRWGASTEVFNLRKQRPVDLAESQEMRFLLNATNISLTNCALPVRQKYTAWLQGNEVIAETYEELLTMSDEGNTINRTCSSTKIEACKYFNYPTGCARGSKCFYAHSGEELRQKKHETDTINSSTAQDLDRKIFVGGLPLSLDSDSLQKIFEEKFGMVDDAKIVGVQTGDKIQSRGFGFVTFKHKKSVSAAVEAHYVALMGKQVEIKSALPKCLLLAELQKSPSQDEQEQNDQHLPRERTPEVKSLKEMAEWMTPEIMAKEDVPSEKTEKEMASCRTTEEAKSKPLSWADALICDQQRTFSDESRMYKENMPTWLRTFRKWLPDFLKQVVKRDGEYALSSLKADFRAAFGLELDHTSLGFLKLSDFMRSFPDLCRIEFARMGKQKPANHMILFPSLHKSHHQPLEPPKIDIQSSHATDSSSNGDTNESKSGFLDVQLLSNENDDSTDGSSKLSHQMSDENPEGSADSVTSFFLQFLEPDPTFHDRPWLYGESDSGAGDPVHGGELGEEFKAMKPQPLEQHVVLESLSRKRNNSSVFFLREFDFYDNYKASIVQGRCFSCNQHRLLWANFPCQHLLWCADCKPQITQTPFNFEHKCVVCDVKVQKIDLISWQDHHYTTDNTALIEFPPFTSDYIRNLSKKRDLF
ncbi:uncharacterized protein LOC105644184 isoform X2 [Jatropha curcas]|uniref:uncharacterized protein LOC105644184 isoform X2 n=1 Tax=Jatropha curcas TaxID=180498 RepID=UPI0009D6A424|nr:uncharacterized protein LOC105644184 isoform X2 [Jatropha curcas]